MSASPPLRGAHRALLAWLCLAALLILAAPTHARATPLEDFARARNAFTFGNYPEAIRLLTSLLAPLQLRDEAQVVEARQLLGVCHYFVRSFFAAQEEFERLLYVRPRHELDPLLFPPPVIEFFEKVRTRIKDKLALLHPENRTEPAVPTLILRKVEKRHRLLAFFPFGVGQLQNGRAGKALFFLASELAMLATNLITYGVAESRRLADGRFNTGDESLVRGLRVAQIVSLCTLGALVIGGVVDALVEHQSEVVSDQRVTPPADSGTPPQNPPTRSAPRERSSTTERRLQWNAWAQPGSAGLSWGWRF